LLEVFDVEQLVVISPRSAPPGNERKLYILYPSCGEGSFCTNFLAMVPAQLYCVQDFVVETNGGQLCSPHSSLWQKIRYDIYESAGEETKVCFNMVLCRLIAEVSALVDDHLDSLSPCWFANADCPSVPIAWEGAGQPHPIKPKLAWCASVAEPPGEVIQDVKLTWDAVVENADCMQLYGPKGPSNDQ
jgi:hypothetical protein